MNDDLPEPLTTAEDDVRGLDGFMLNVQRLLSSELWALSSGDEFKAALGLWAHAWQQVPAGSLPDDDRVLASFSGDKSKWKKVKDMALRGFVKCSDGRLYQRTLCEDVKRAAVSKAEFEAAKQGDAERKRKEREERSQLFAQLKAVGVTPLFNTSTSELRKLVTANVTSVTVTSHGHVTPPVTVTVTANTGQDSTIQDSKGLDGIGSAGRRDRKSEWDQLRDRCVEAAGWQNARANGNLEIIGPIAALIENGADLEQDVLPVIRQHAPKIRKPNWNYFVECIAQARDNRINASQIVSSPLGGTHANPTHNPQPKPKSAFAIHLESIRDGMAAGDFKHGEPETVGG